LFDLGRLPGWAWVGMVVVYYLVVAPLLLALKVPPTAAEEAEETARPLKGLLGWYQEQNERLRHEVAQLRTAQAEGQRYCERLEAENRLQGKAIDEYRLEILKRGDNTGDGKNSEVDLG
jgi:hypothetical protein